LKPVDTEPSEDEDDSNSLSGDEDESNSLLGGEGRSVTMYARYGDFVDDATAVDPDKAFNAESWKKLRDEEVFTSNTNLSFVPLLPYDTPAYTGGRNRLQDLHYCKAWQLVNADALEDLDLEALSTHQELYEAASRADEHGYTFLHPAEVAAFSHYVKSTQIRAQYEAARLPVQQPAAPEPVVADTAGNNLGNDNDDDEHVESNAHVEQKHQQRGERLSSALDLNQADGSSYFSQGDTHIRDIPAGRRSSFYKTFTNVRVAIKADKSYKGIARASELQSFLSRFPDMLRRVDAEREQAGLPQAYLALLVSSMLEEQTIKDRFNAFVEDQEFAPTQIQISTHLRQASGGDVTITADAQNLLDVTVPVTGKPGHKKADIFRFLDRWTSATRSYETAYGQVLDPVLQYELVRRKLAEASQALCHKWLQPPAVVLDANGTFTADSLTTALTKLREIVLADTSHPDTGCVAADPPDQKLGGANRHLNLMTRGGRDIQSPCQVCQPPRNNHEAADCFELPKNAHRRPSNWKPGRGLKSKRERPGRGGDRGGDKRHKKRPYGLSESEVNAALASHAQAKQAKKINQAKQASTKQTGDASD